VPPILFQDSRFAVLDKPAGLPVHPVRTGGPSAEDWFPELSRRKSGPWLAHRLDRDTAGCLLVALRRPALLEAQACFAEGRAEKAYWAVVRGAPPGDTGQIEAPLLKRRGPDGWRVVADPAGQPARTSWRVLGRGDGIAWLELAPHTGRTHQVRVHCAALGCPVLGDAQYGGGEDALHLLARSLRLPLTPPIAATAPPPAHMRAALERCGASAFA
jgi:tRNA pseudouridine32 synthase / 23S rRNA pseudouridine746 synthase